MKIERFDDIHYSYIPLLYDWYAETFKEVNRRAAQRHVMTLPEFEEVCFDTHVQKWLVREDDDQTILGMATITNDLKAWPLVSPEYYEAQLPDHYKRKAIWYIGFLGTTRHDLRVFSALAAHLVPQVFESNGILAMDFCTYNVASRKLPSITYLQLQRLNPDVQAAKLDSQETWAYRFDSQGVTK